MNNNNLARLLGPIIMYIPYLAQIEAQITIIGVNNSHNSNRLLLLQGERLFKVVTLA